MLGQVARTNLVDTRLPDPQFLKVDGPLHALGHRPLSGPGERQMLKNSGPGVHEGLEILALKV